MARRWQPQTLGQYHDLWTVIMGKAPAKFRDIVGGTLLIDQKTALLEEFERLRSNFDFARRSIKDDRVCRIVEELISMSLESYLSEDQKTGAHTLAEAEGLIWPSRRMRVKYGVEAERRAFGENILYANVVVSPYPYEGTVADLGSDQIKLLDLAERWVSLFQTQGRDFKYFSWVLDSAGVIKRTSSEPKEDDHAVLQPVQRSWGFKRLKELGQTHQIRACVLMEIVGPRGDGIVSYELEQQGRPRVSARQLFKRRAGETQHEAMRFHLMDPEFITE